MVYCRLSQSQSDWANHWKSRFFLASTAKLFCAWQSFINPKQGWCFGWGLCYHHPFSSDWQSSIRGYNLNRKQKLKKKYLYSKRAQRVYTQSIRRVFKKRGHSLIQLLFSLLLSSLIIAGAVLWYQIAKKTVIIAGQKESNLSHARFFVQYLRQDLKSSGYLGCRSKDDSYPINPLFMDYLAPYKYWRSTHHVYGFNTRIGNCLGRMLDSVCENVKENSELLIIYNIARNFRRLKQAMKDPADPILTEGPHSIRKDSMVLIADCLQGDIFIANEVDSTRIFHEKNSKNNTQSQLSKVYFTDAEVAELQTVVYYLGKPEREKRTAGCYSLYRKDLLHKAVEIIDNIKNLDIQYGFCKPMGTGVTVLQYKDSQSMQEDEWAFIRFLRIKIIFINNEEWNYEFAVGNRRYINLSVDFVNKHLFYIGSSFIANYFARKNG